MAWRAARSLLVLHQQLQAGAPRARPPATGADEWGLLGDVAHDPTSDHTPHDFPGWGDDIVTAADFPNRPDLGLDAHQVLDDIRRSRDPRAKYGISNGQIFSNHPVTEHGHSYGAWEWRPYLTSSGAKPADGHYTHGHLSVVGDARADGQQPWQTIGGDDMTPEQDRILRNIDTWLQKIGTMQADVPLVGPDGKTGNWTNKTAGALAAAASATIDVASFAASLAPLLSNQLGLEVSKDALVAALNSDEGQAALVRAANAAEDS
jgi:hypothetical protein